MASIDWRNICEPIANLFGCRVYSVKIARIRFRNGESTPSFENGDEADYAQDLKTLREVILPKIHNGVSVQSFEGTDRKLKDYGPHSLGNIIRCFFGTDNGVALNAVEDGTFTITNGRHRIWLAKKLGFDSIPAIILGEQKCGIATKWQGRWDFLENIRNPAVRDQFQHGRIQMAQARIDPDRLEAFSHHLAAYATELNNYCDTVNSSLDRLGHTFDDDDYRDFRASFNNSLRTIYQFTESVGPEIERMKSMIEYTRRNQAIKSTS